MSKIPITPEGYRNLLADLDRMKTVERPRVVQDLNEAAARGDLSENSEYEDAKERLAILNRKVVDLEGRIMRAEVIDPATLQSDRVVFGATVQLKDLETDEEETWQLVGVDEVDVKKGRISIASPIARALLGKQVGDTARVQVPKGIREFEVNAISFK